MEDYEETAVDYCPECGVGQIGSGKKPYLRLFHGKLFTIPDALIWCCDVCSYYEFDDTVYDIIDQMVSSSLPDSDHYGRIRHFPHLLDDDNTLHSGKPGAI